MTGQIHRRLWQGLLAGFILLSAGSGRAQATDFSVSSTDMPNGSKVVAAAVRGDCGGGNQSPALAWTTPPAGTRSLAITLHDPDAPKAGGWWHWLAFDLPAPTRRLPRGAANGGLPPGSRQSANDYAQAGYDGPCPPAGKSHHYVLTIWALDVDRLDVHNLAPADLARQFDGHVLGKARLTALFGR